MDWLSVIGSVASLVGLALTVYVAVTVRSIRRRYLRQVVFRECRDKLLTHRKNLSRAVKRESPSGIRMELARVQAGLRRVALHDAAASAVDWSVSGLDTLLQADDRIVLSRVNEVLPRIDGYIETLELRLTELDWGKDDV
jgi:hypothetical protein